MIAVEVDRHRIERRLETRYLDVMAETVDEALARARAAAGEGRALSIGLLGNAADVLPELVRRGVVPDLVTDQTSAHDPLNGYVPNRMSYERALALRQVGPRALHGRGPPQHGRARPGDAGPQGARVGGLRLRQQHPRRGREGRRPERVRLPGLRARLHPAAVLRGQGPVPLGLPVGRPRRPRGHGRRRPRDLPGGPRPRPLDPPRPRAGEAPGAPVAHLLARLRRAGEDGPRLQRARAHAAA